MAITPTLADIITAALDARLAETWVALPGRVQSYSSADNAADVLPMLRHPAEATDGSTVNEDLPVVPACPVLWPATAGGALTFPIVAGDYGMLLVLTHSASTFLDSGQVSDPGDVRRHHLANAVFLPGFGPKSAKPTYAGDPDVVLDSQTFVRVGGGATDFAALAAKVNANFDALKVLLETTGLPVAGGVAKAASVTYPNASVAATKAKVE